MPALELISAHPDYVLLLLLRVGGMLIGGPVFGRKNVPAASKIGFCAVLTLVFLLSAPVPEAYPAIGSVVEYGLACLRELLFGAAMGFVLTAMFSVALTAGSIVDYQIGYSMASVYDVQNGVQAPLSGSLLNLMLLLLFFSMDGHLRLIAILHRTLETVPVGRAAAAPEILWTAAETVSRSFLLALMVAMPVLAAGLMMEIALGAMIRTVPQMNMFVVGIPLKIVVGLLVLALTLAVFADFSRGIFTQAFDYVGAMFDSLAGAS